MLSVRQLKALAAQDAGKAARYFETHSLNPFVVNIHSDHTNLLLTRMFFNVAYALAKRAAKQ